MSPRRAAAVEGQPDRDSRDRAGDSLAARVDALAADRAAAGTAPALAVGVFTGGKLRATVLRGGIDGAGRPPRADTAFRIASCTKSFTAAAVLILRDRGLLDLDSEVSAHLPYLRLIGPGEDMPNAPLTLRMLLTMCGGLPTDDPWADRQEAMSGTDFEALLGAGVRLVRTPGTAYEYSNLGYAMLGAVITAAAGRGYTEVVREELLEPLGLWSTGFDAGVRAAGEWPRAIAVAARRGNRSRSADRAPSRPSAGSSAHLGTSAAGRTGSPTASPTGRSPTGNH